MFIKLAETTVALNFNISLLRRDASNERMAGMNPIYHRSSVLKKNQLSFVLRQEFFADAPANFIILIDTLAVKKLMRGYHYL